MRLPLALILIAATPLAAPLTGCRTGSGIQAVGLTGVQGNAEIEAGFPTAVYAMDESGSADIYLTDLPPAAFDLGFPAGEINGQIVHIALFITPRATRTPISNDATNAVIRHAVFAGGGETPIFGIYEGAGFVLPGGAPGKDRFTGDIAGASTALLSSTPGFPDLLGITVTDVWFSARLEPITSRLIRRRLDQAITDAETIDRPEGDPLR